MSVTPVWGGPSGVDIVRADLDQQGELGAVLSPEEAARAGRYRRLIDRDRYVAGRGLLRTLLGERLNEDPAKVQITTGPNGKPRVATGGPLAFNLAHGAGDVLFAFSHGGEIGIDIEHVTALDSLALSQTCFSIAERRELRALHGCQRLVGFFDGWVRKEAVIKADGRGMSLDLHTFTVNLNGPARLVDPPPGDDLDSWCLQSLDLGPQLRAAVAVRY